jgi:hypothetical protein
MKNPFRKRKREFQGTNPFVSKKDLARFLGQVAGAVFNEELNEKQAHEIERLVVDFLKVLNVHDFTFEVSDALTHEPTRERYGYTA